MEQPTAYVPELRSLHSTTHQLSFWSERLYSKQPDGFRLLKKP